jgi:hypothetical protein
VRTTDTPKYAKLTIINVSNMAIGIVRLGSLTSSPLVRVKWYNYIDLFKIFKFK